MGHGSTINPDGPTIRGQPLHPIEGDDVLLVEGTIGNPILLNDDDLFGGPSQSLYGGSFFVLVAAKRRLQERSAERSPECSAERSPECSAEHSAEEIAETFRDRHRLQIGLFQPAGETPSSPPPVFDVMVEPKMAFHYLDQGVHNYLRFRPELSHLRALYGNDIDFYMVGCRLPNQREAIFGRALRTGVEPDGRPSGESVDTVRYDIIQRGVNGAVEALHRGGLAIFDRQSPDGLPINLQAVTLADLHLAFQNDELQERIVGRIGDHGMFLRFNNANANFVEAIIPWINREYLAGRLDFVLILGDSVDFDGRDHETSTRLVESNEYLLARFLNRIRPPVYAGLGNHEVLGEGAPASLNAANFNLTGREVMDLQADRYGCSYGDPCPITVDGSFLWLKDATEAIIYDPNTLISYYDLINPFHDFSLDLGRGEPANPQSPLSRLIYMDTGGADLSHFRQDDPIYQDLQVWPWGMPLLHLQTIWETFTQSSPDVEGPDEGQISWLADQLGRGGNAVFLTHAPLVNSSDHQTHFNWDPQAPLSSMQRMPSGEDLSFNTIAHRRQLLRLIADSPTPRLHLTAHTHFDGNGFLMGLGPDNGIEIFQGPVREALNFAFRDNPAAVRNLWFPRERDFQSWPRELQRLFGGSIRDLHNTKVTWQIGPAGVGATPGFSRLTINPEGLVSREEHFYVIKRLEQIPPISPGPNAPPRYTVRREIFHIPLRNDRLVQEWERVREQHPNAYLDMTGELQAARERQTTSDTSFLPNAGSLHPYPRYDQEVHHPTISPTDLNSHLRLRLLGDVSHSLGASAEYVLNERQIGRVWRNLILEGPEIGWFLTDEGDHHFFGNLRFPPLVDWMLGQLPDTLLLRGLGFMIGGEMVVRRDGRTSLFPALNLNLFELGYRTGSFEYFLGLDYPHILSSRREFRGVGGINFVF